MKKFWKKVRRSSPARSGESSPKSGSTRGSVASLNIGYEVREKDLSKLHKAAWTGNLNKVKQLARKDPSPLDKENRTPLHLACVQGNEHIVQELLEWKAKVNIGDNASRTPLMRAVEFGQEGCVGLLLAYRVDVDTKDSYGNTALHIAVEAGNTNVVGMLLKAGATRDLTNKEGLAPLHVAVKHKQEEICRLMLKERANVDVEDINLRTPLMHACQDGSVNLVKLLLEFNANTQHKDSKDWSADDCADIQGHHSCSLLIREHASQRGRASTASTPRSGSWQPSSVLSTPRGHDPMGLPALDGAGDDSDNETNSRASAAPGSDSWADSSQADEVVDKPKEGSDVDDAIFDEDEPQPKISIAKFAHNIHVSESETDGESVQDPKTKPQAAAAAKDSDDEEENNGVVQGTTSFTPNQASKRQTSWHSQTSGEDNSWGDSPTTPRKNSATRVSFKRDEELSEVHDINVTSSESEAQDQVQAGVGTGNAGLTGSYVPSAGTNVGTTKPAQEKMLALMAELGLSDVDDVSDMSDEDGPAPALPQSPPPKLPTTNQRKISGGGDSDWDTSVMSDIMTTPRPGILKNRNTTGNASSGIEDPNAQSPPLGVKDSPAQQPKLLIRAPAIESGDESSEWDTTEADKIEVPAAKIGGNVQAVDGTGATVGARQHADSISEWDSDIEEMVNPTQAVMPGTTPTPPPPLPTATITKEVEAIVRQKQAEQDSEKEEDDDDDDEEESRGRGKPDFDDDDWDSTVDSVSQKNNAGLQFKEVNVDTPASQSDHAPALAYTPVAQAAMVVSSSAPMTAAAAEEDSDAWDSDENVPSETGAPPAYMPGLGGIGGGAAIVSEPMESQEVETVKQISPQKKAEFMVGFDDDEDEDEESESISSWELQRKAERQAQLSARSEQHQDDIDGITRKENESWVDAQRRMQKEEGERLKKEKEEREKLAEEEEKQQLIEERLRHEREEEEQRQREEEERQKREIQEELQRQQKQEEDRRERERQEMQKQQELEEAAERQREEQIQLQWEREEEERIRQEEMQRMWEMEEERKAEQLRRESQELLENEMKEDLLMTAEEAVVSTDYGFSHQHELNRIDEQFKREKAERQRKEEDQEEEHHRKERNEESTYQQEKMEEASIIGLSSTSPPPPVLSPRSTAPATSTASNLNSQASSGPYVNIGSSTVEQIRQRLQVVPTPASPSSPVIGGLSRGSALFSSPDGFDDNDSVLSENPGDDRPGLRPFNHSMYRPNDPLDDDALSYTSTEFEDNVQSSPNYAKDRDLIATVNVGDPSSLLKVQEHVRDTRRQLEQERNQRQVLENKVKVINKEKAELNKKLETITSQRSALEQTKLDLEANIRSLQYNMSEEEEKRKNAELLLEKTKEQLARKENQFASELEAKQRAELSMRNLQIEMRTSANTIKELEDEKEELQRQIGHANSARLLQEQINEDQQKLIHAHTFQQQATPRESDTPNLEQAADTDKLRAEVYALQMEMDRQRSRFKDEVAMISAENEELQARVDDLKNDIKLNEEALAHATMQYNMQVASLRSEIATSTTNAERERAGREKVETELESLQTRLVAANHEMDKVVRARNELEREQKREKEGWTREMDRKEAEVVTVKDNLQHVNQRLQTTETKLNSMENELHVSTTSLMERTSQLQQLKQELDRVRSAHEALDQSYRLDKEQGAKTQAKLEHTQEKLSTQQHENLSLRQQLDSLKLSGGGLPGSDANEKLNNILSNLRAESDRAKATLEEKNSRLLEDVARLKEEARGAEVRRAALEADLRRLQEEHADLVRRAASAEASLQVATRAKDQMEQERATLRAELEQAQQRYQASHDKATEAQTRVSELLDRLDKAESSSALSTQQLANTSANMQGLFKSKTELDESMQQIQVENARLEAELKYEKQRADMLQQDLQDSQKVRSSLEALCANLKSTSAHLEDRLGEETAARVMYEADARDHKALYDLETKSRSKLGLKIADLERNKQLSDSKLGEEKNRSEAANQKQRNMETQLETEIEKNRQLQRDVNTLKAHLKTAKTKIKDLGGSSPRPTAGPQYSDFQRDVNNLETHVSTPRHQQGLVADAGGDVRAELEAKYRAELNRKLADVNRFLESQSHLQGKLDTSRTEVEVTLQTDKRRLEDENKSLRIKFEQAVAQRETKEMEARRFRELYESEMKWRLRVSDQLQLATEKSFNLSSKLNNERYHRNRLTSNIGNLHSTILLNNSFDTATGNAGVGTGTFKTNGFHDDELSNKIKSELDKSIARHLEAAPHDHNRPVLRPTKEPTRFSSALTQASHDYIDVLKRKYCV